MDGWMLIGMDNDEWRNMRNTNNNISQGVQTMLVKLYSM